MSTNLDKMNTNLSRDNKQGWSTFTWIIIFLPFIIYSIRNLRIIVPDYGSKFLGNIDLLNISNTINDSDSLNLLIKILGSILPIVSIFIFEIFSKSKTNLNLKNSSIGKIRFSKGYKYADIWYFALSHISKLPLLFFILTLGTSFFNEGVKNWFHVFYEKNIPLSSNTTLITITFIFAILLNDFIGYIKHRVEHKVPLLWDLHEFHHSATEMTILSNYRNVPLIDILFTPLSVPFNIFSGLIINEYLSRGLVIPLYVFLFDSIVRYSFLFLGHSSLKIIYPKPFSFFLLSPALHWLHHSDNPKHFDKNFGSKYTFWDKLFGTYLGPSHLKDLVGFGVNKTQYNKYHPLYSYCILPYNKLIKRIKSGKIFIDKIQKQA